MLSELAASSENDFSCEPQEVTGPKQPSAKAKRFLVIEHYGPVTMIYGVIASLGVVLFLGALYLAQTIRLREPRLSRLQPAIPVICFGAMAMGVAIFLSAAVASAWSVGR